MFQKTIRSFILILFLMTTSCTPTGSGISNNFPNLFFDCHTAEVTSCDSQLTENKATPIYVGLIIETGHDCRASLAQVIAGKFRLQYDAYAESTAVYKAGFVSSAIYSWLDPQNSSINDLASGEIILCAFIDLNKDGNPDTGEPYLQSVLERESSKQTLFFQDTY